MTRINLRALSSLIRRSDIGASESRVAIPRVVRKRWRLDSTKVLLDVAVLCCAYGLAFLIRFEGRLSSQMLATLLITPLFVIPLKLACLAVLRVPSLPWRHVSLPDASRILAALALASGAIGVWKLLAYLTSATVYPGYPNEIIPLGVLMIDLLLSFFGITGLRLCVRLWVERVRHGQRDNPSRRKVPTLLIGAGSAGALVAKTLAASPDAGIQPLGFLDDDASKLGQRIHGVQVLGTTQEIERIVKESGAQQALITIGNVSGPAIRRIVNRCARSKIPAKVIPGIREMVGGSVRLTDVRQVAIEDLLRRDPVKLDNRAIAEMVGARRVLITGAGGSIGSELCREVARFGPEVLVLVEQAENSLFQIHRRLSQEFPAAVILPYVADICDVARMKEIFARWRPNLVLHAAAHKHVPLMECNPGEAIKNNIAGTRTVANLAHAFGVHKFVMISTDKAVRPTSVMGVTKRIAEIYIQALSKTSQTRFSAVRFGNVLDSNGSVIPIFKEQIASGGPVTVTHPDMKRYFMTIPEACQLVLQAATLGQGGEIFLLDMGEPVRIVDLATDLIRLSGYTLDEIEIKFVGMRPGEKLYEELSFGEEDVQRTKHPKIFVGRLLDHDLAEIDRRVNELGRLVACEDESKIFRALKEITPDYACSESRSTEGAESIAVHLYHGLAGVHRNGHAANGNGHAGKTAAGTLAKRVVPA